MTETTLNPARVVAVQEDIVSIQMAAEHARPLVKNEVVYICPQRESEGRTEKLKAEVLRVDGREAVAQVFESTRGIGIGDLVEQSGNLLSVTLGPGLLGQVYDGLQNPLEGLAVGHGTFLPRGVYVPSLDMVKKWAFNPAVEFGTKLKAGDTLGTVQEGR